MRSSSNSGTRACSDSIRLVGATRTTTEMGRVVRILLMLEIPVCCQEDIEAVCGQPKQFAVLLTAPAHRCHRSYFVRRQQRGKCSWQRLIEQDAHRPAAAPWRRFPVRPSPARASQTGSGQGTRRGYLLPPNSRQGSLTEPLSRGTQVSRPRFLGHCERLRPRLPRRLSYSRTLTPHPAPPALPAE